MQCLRGMDLLRREEELERTSFSNEHWKPLCASPSRDQAQSRSAMSEHGVRGGDAPMTRKGQVQASTHAVALDSGVDGTRKFGNRFHQSLPHPGKLKRGYSVQCLNFREVRSRRKEPCIA